MTTFGMPWSMGSKGEACVLMASTAQNHLLVELEGHYIFIPPTNVHAMGVLA